MSVYLVIELSRRDEGCEKGALGVQCGSRSKIEKSQWAVTTYILQNATQQNDPAVSQSEDAYGIQQNDIQQNDTWQNDQWQNANKKITRKVIRKTLKKLKLSELRNKIGMFLKFFFRYQQYATPKSCFRQV
jgi:hypothetical protein